LPVQQLPGLGDVRTALLRIVFGQRQISNLAMRTGDLLHQTRTLQDRELVWISNVHWFTNLGSGEAQNAFDLITHVAETTCLRPIAVDGERFAAYGLLHEVGDHTPVIQLQSRTVRIEDAENVRVYPVITQIRHGHGFSEAFGFVVNRTRADGVYMTPITF